MEDMYCCLSAIFVKVVEVEWVCGLLLSLYEIEDRLRAEMEYA